MIGISANTSQFAVAAIRSWWEQFGSLRYSEAHHLFIEADTGGCNRHRPRLWKWELQKWADETGLMIAVCHYPTGVSKWNPIEHRLFSQVSRNWAGHPLRSIPIMLSLLRGTTTTKGLTVDAELDSAQYAKGIKITDQEMKSLNIHHRTFCSNLNYTIKPRESGIN